jgi:hypothetical protein
VAVTRSPDDFPATLGPSERWSTIAAVALGVVGMSALGIAFAMETGEPRWLFLGLPFSAVLFLAGRYAPSGYRLAADGVRIERRAGPVRIPYREIRAADRSARPPLGLSVLASRGVFGVFGRFWSTRLGFYRLYLTNRTTIVWLDTTRGWVAVSPDRPDEFLARLQARI